MPTAPQQEDRIVAQRPRLERLRRTDPDRIGPYALLGRLGAGAMGRVYLGRSAAGRLVAVKTIRDEYAEEPDFRARFAHEVAAARRVSGVFTAAVVAADPDAETPWLATAYVPAPSLARLVEACGPLPVPAVRWLAAGCAEALESIHDAGLVHRDLKPSNVLVSQDGPRVIDFGVARAVERIQLTATRAALGTPAYMAPEQARDTRQATTASDVFSLGSTLLYAATGHAPYEGDTVVDVLVRLATQPPDLTGLPRELMNTVGSCLQRDPAGRPTPAAVVAELAPKIEFEAGDGPPSLPGPALALMEEYRKRPQPSMPAAESPPADLTVGSGPVGSDWPPWEFPAPRSPGPVADAPATAGPSPSGPTPSGLTPSEPMASEPRSQADSSGPGGRGSAGPERADGSVVAAAEARSPAVRRHTRLAPVLLLVAAVAALMVVSALAGVWVARDSAKPSQQAQPGPPPPGREPPPPLPGAYDRPTGSPSVVVNQPMGDGNTIFVLHGRGWTPGTPITIALVGGPTSPRRPVADKAGTFNYAVNQQQEFFRGGLPPGRYVLVATASGGRRAEAGFRVTP